MNKYILIPCVLAFFLCVDDSAIAQSYTSLQYAVSIPTGDLQGHTSKTSFRGVNFEYQHFVTTAISVGIDIAYNVFYERKSYDTYTQGSVSVSGVQYRYNNIVPVYGKGYYYLLTDGEFLPYVGLGIGALYNLRNTDMGVYTIEEKNWHFAIAPEAGVMIEVSSEVGIKLGLKYTNSFKSNKANAISFLAFNVGVIWRR